MEMEMEMEMEMQMEMDMGSEYEGNSSSSSSASSFTDETIGEDEQLIHEQANVAELPFMPQAMETPGGGNTVTGAHNSTEVVMNNAIEASNVYCFPTTNLPPEFRLDFSSTFQLPQMEQGIWSGSSLASTNWINWQHFSQITTTREPAINFGPQGIGYQALLNQVIVSDNFHVNDDVPRMMNWQEDPNLHFMEWLSLREGNRPQNVGVSGASSSRHKAIENKVYDPSYAAMGLPVDPHLRMFQAMNAKNNNNNNNNNDDDYSNNNDNNNNNNNNLDEEDEKEKKEVEENN
ncbi:putative uncharacterized protein DDB_G0272516 [Hibiscus syriacus]|uniref:putative uncharacterized protein DDB_G0272516 n=1 Tax=Hibiscus syriacus TaxID=106335 RepID=UPI001923CFCC|nr:putative uncharacterized protein DDB_G0272516 [Hibiscus syriacus]